MAEPAGLMSTGNHWQSWPSVLLLVDPLLRCSLDVSLAVTDASVSDIRIFIHLSLHSTWTNGRWSCCGECLLHCGMLPHCFCLLLSLASVSHVTLAFGFSCIVLKVLQYFGIRCSTHVQNERSGRNWVAGYICLAAVICLFKVTPSRISVSPFYHTENMKVRMWKVACFKIHHLLPSILTGW
jgi:hypothetical protein